VDLDGGPSLVLRMYTADPSACGREAAILAAFAGRVPVSQVFHAEPSAEPPFSLMGWLEGTPLDRILADAEPDDAREIALVCGSALATIHSIRFDGPGFLDPNLAVATPMSAWTSAMLSTLADAEARLGDALSHRVRRAVKEDAQAVEAVWSQAVLVHADYKPWNLLGRVDGAPQRRLRPPGAPTFELTGILDWEFSCAGCRLIDFGTFLRDEPRRPEGFGDAFASGYVAGGGSLPHDWRRLMLLVDLVSLLQMASRSSGQALDDLRRLIGDTIDALG